MEAANSPIFSEICWKMAKNAPFHIKSPVKNFHRRAKGGAIAPWFSLKYATVCRAVVQVIEVNCTPSILL